MRKLAGTGGVWLLACTALLAADFWDETDFTTWSDEEVEKMLTDSPWAQRATVLMGGLTPAADDIDLSDVVRQRANRVRLEDDPLQAGIGTNIPDPEGGGEQFQRIRRLNVTVTWSSALPMKLAQLKRLLRSGAPIPPQVMERLTGDAPFYTLAVVGLPAPFAALAPMVEVLKAHTMLKRKNKAPIAPTFSCSGTRPTGRPVSESDIITLDDTDVFITQLSPDNEVKKKFKLEDMVFGDQLAL